MERRRLGVYKRSRLELASPYLAVAHAGLSTLRDAVGHAPPNQLDPPRRERLSFVLRAVSHDGDRLAQRTGRPSVRHTPHARRIGRLGRGTQGRTEHFVRARDDPRVRQVHRAAERTSVSGDHRCACRRTLRQADAGDAALYPAAAGLLAAEQIQRLQAYAGRPSGVHSTPDRRKASADAPGDPVLRRDAVRSAERWCGRRGRAALDRLAHRQRHAKLRQVPLHGRLADGTRRLLLPPVHQTRRGRGHRGYAAARRVDGDLARSRKETPLRRGGMALVRRNARSRNRRRSGRFTNASRPLHLRSADRHLHRRCVDVAQLRDPSSSTLRTAQTRCHRNHNGLPRRANGNRSCADRLLARQRHAVPTSTGRDYGQLPGPHVHGPNALPPRSRAGSHRALRNRPANQPAGTGHDLQSWIRLSSKRPKRRSPRSVQGGVALSAQPRQRELPHRTNTGRGWGVSTLDRILSACASERPSIRPGARTSRVGAVRTRSIRRGDSPPVAVAGGETRRHGDAAATRTVADRSGRSTQRGRTIENRG